MLSSKATYSASRLYIFYQCVPLYTTSSITRTIRISEEFIELKGAIGDCVKTFFIILVESLITSW